MPFEPISNNNLLSFFWTILEKSMHFPYKKAVLDQGQSVEEKNCSLRGAESNGLGPRKLRRSLPT